MKAMMARLLSILLLGVASVCGEFQTFTSPGGSTLEAEVLGFEGEDQVCLQLKGRSSAMVVGFDKFCEEDRKRLEAMREESGPNAEGDFEALNEAAGHELFAGTGLLGRKAGEVAKSLKIPKESTADGLESWRLYAVARPPRGMKAGDYRLFGTVPYSVALYANSDGGFRQLSAVYSNKGDFGSNAGFAMDHFEQSGLPDPDTLNEAMEADMQIISTQLTEVLGEPEKQRFGEKKSRRDALRWDAGDVSILLAAEEDEFVNLSIVPKSLADNGGRTERTSDAALKARLESAVIRKDNGDVVIRGIPMVNQGPKGYCVPATFERAMRFMGVDADMYLLAMVGQTGVGGGTSPTLLVDAVKSKVYSKARRVREEAADDLRLSKLTRFLDEGTPVMWRMCSLEAYNEIANKNTRARRKVEDWDEWRVKVAEQNEQYAGLEKGDGNHHICLIVGYNAETQELAVSDSWGPSYELRWVPLEVANWVHNGQLLMILP